MEKTSLILSSQNVRDILLLEGSDTVMDRLIQDLQGALDGLDSDEMNIPARSGFNYSRPYPGLIEFMPLYKTGEKVTVKIVGYHPKNPKVFNVPTILSTIYMFDTSTGHLRAMMDGVLATALRTGAISAVASNLMAHPGSEVLGIIGCGAQGITQIHALSRMFTFKEILYYDIDEESLHSFTSRLEPLGLSANMKRSSLDDIRRESDIICTATSVEIGKGPVFLDGDHKKWLHINAVGSDFPGKTELPVEMLNRATVIPDFLAQAMHEGECQQLLSDKIGPEIAGVLNDRAFQKKMQQELTVFDSTGWALEDYVVLELFMQYAEKHNLGSRTQIEYFPEDTKNPYEFLQAVHSSKSLSNS